MPTPPPPTQTPSAAPTVPSPSASDEAPGRSSKGGARYHTGRATIVASIHARLARLPRSLVGRCGVILSHSEPFSCNKTTPLDTLTVLLFTCPSPLYPGKLKWPRFQHSSYIWENPIVFGSSSRFDGCPRSLCNRTCRFTGKEIYESDVYR